MTERRYQRNTGRISRRERMRRRRLAWISLLGCLFLLLVILFGLFHLIRTRRNPITKTGAIARDYALDAQGLEISEDFLTPNEYSRPGDPLPKVNYLVIHYTANPGSNGWNNRNYFENLKDSHTTYASSHFIIGLDGTIIQCIPLNEICYASNERNEDSIAIECCHPEKDGKFTQETYDSLIKLTAWLAGEYNLDSDHIIRHYDVTGKICPKYFVDHEDAWEQFKEEVFQYLEENGEEK